MILDEGPKLPVAGLHPMERAEEMFAALGSGGTARKLLLAVAD